MFKDKKRKRPPIKASRQIFHGIAIRPGDGACSSARGLSNLRFLADDAPMLPLGDCTNVTGCTCKYEHFDDRRTQARRDADIGLPLKDHTDNLRNGTGRRVTDG